MTAKLFLFLFLFLSHFLSWGQSQKDTIRYSLSGSIGLDHITLNRSAIEGINRHINKEGLYVNMNLETGVFIQQKWGIALSLSTNIPRSNSVYEDDAKAYFTERSSSTHFLDSIHHFSLGNDNSKLLFGPFYRFSNEKWGITGKLYTGFHFVRGNESVLYLKGKGTNEWLKEQWYEKYEPDVFFTLTSGIAITRNIWQNIWFSLDVEHAITPVNMRYEQTVENLGTGETSRVYYDHKTVMREWGVRAGITFYIQPISSFL